MLRSFTKRTTFSGPCRWDILNTINIDTEIEDERDEAMKHATLILMKNMQLHGDIDQSVVDKATQKFKKYVRSGERQAERERERERRTGRHRERGRQTQRERDRKRERETER